MAIWPFNRKQDSADLPQEVQDYYKTEKGQKPGVAGLLALGTLVVTVLLALGLFFGGRWAYRAAFKDDKKPGQVAQAPSDESADNADESTAQTDQTPPEPTPLPPAQTPSPTTPTPTPGRGSGTPAQATLPATGPNDALVIAFSAVFFGTAWYYVFGNKKQFAKED